MAHMDYKGKNPSAIKMQCWQARSIQPRLLLLRPSQYDRKVRIHISEVGELKSIAMFED